MSSCLPAAPVRTVPRTRPNLPTLPTVPSRLAPRPMIEVHILQTPKHTFLASVGLMGISSGRLVTLVVVWSFPCTVSLIEDSLEPGWCLIWPLKFVWVLAGLEIIELSLTLLEQVQLLPHYSYLHNYSHLLLFRVTQILEGCLDNKGIS